MRKSKSEHGKRSEEKRTKSERQGKREKERERKFEIAGTKRTGLCGVKELREKRGRKKGCDEECE